MPGKPSKLSIALWLAPIIGSTTFSHLTQGPPAKSWTLKYNIMMAIIKAYTSTSGSNMTPEQMQRGSIRRTQPLSKRCSETEFTVGMEWREKGGALLDNALGNDMTWDWRGDRTTAAPLQASWIQPNDNSTSKKTLLYLHGGAYFLGTYKLYRPLLGKLAVKADARVLAVDYRLAPQHPFPCGLEDALAAYLYLLAPPPDAPFAPVPASDIVISGDSAGGGLTMALLMMIRDHGLPVPGGAIPISPWVDLTSSLPSCHSNRFTDYLPPTFADPHHDMTKQLHHYVPNSLLRHPLVSPLNDPHHWHGLPPLLIQTGDAEQLRDESVCASLKATAQYDTLASHPPTNVTLDLYDDMPHVFQLLLPTAGVQRSIDTMAAFLRNPTLTGLTIRRVDAQGQVDDITTTMVDHHQTVWESWLHRLNNTPLVSAKL